MIPGEWGSWHFKCRNNWTLWRETCYWKQGAVSGMCGSSQDISSWRTISSVWKFHVFSSLLAVEMARKVICKLLLLCTCTYFFCTKWCLYWHIYLYVSEHGVVWCCDSNYTCGNFIFLNENMYLPSVDTFLDCKVYSCQRLCS